MDFCGFLSPEGEEIYDFIKAHCETNLTMMEAYDLELSMLANSFDLYFKCAKVCNDEGVAMVFPAKNGIPVDNDDDSDDLADDEKRAKFETKKGGIYQQIRPEYTVMKNEYANVLKHSGKFGLNPADVMKHFKGLAKKEEKPKGADRFKKRDDAK